jgi:hypothetical protein
MAHGTQDQERKVEILTMEFARSKLRIKTKLTAKSGKA